MGYKGRKDVIIMVSLSQRASLPLGLRMCCLDLKLYLLCLELVHSNVVAIVWGSSML